MATTSVSIIHPSIPVLRKAVEDTFGTHLSNANVETFVSDVLKGQLSSDTIRQLWGWRHTDYSTIRRSTLDVLAQYVGAKDWCDFVQTLVAQSPQDSLLVGVCDGVSYNDLNIGQRIHISWQPDRTACLEYEGAGHFHIVSVTNSNLLRTGDEFDCCMLVVGEPAFLSNLYHEGKDLGGYTIGQTNGLSAISLE